MSACRTKSNASPPQETRARRRPGRPRKGESPRVPYDEVDRLLVHGERGDDGEVIYPTYRELAARYDVSHSTIARFARTHRCLSRRRSENRTQVKEPRHARARGSRPQSDVNEELNFRDRCAVAALPAMYEVHRDDAHETIARRAYELADAMVSESQRRTPKRREMGDIARRICMSLMGVE